MSVVIAGIGELPQGHSSAASPMALHQALIESALADAGLALADVDAILTVSPRADPYLIHASALAEHLGISPAITWTLEAGGAAPAAMVEVGRGLIEGGHARTVLAVAADMPLGAVTRNAYVRTLADTGPVHPDYERPFAPTVPSMFALVARAHMDAFGTTREHLAAVALQDRRMAALHPNAHFSESLSLERYLGGAAIADPLTLFDCAPVSDGGGAFVMTAGGRAAALPRPPARVLATGFATSHQHLSLAPSLVEFGAGRALDQALAAARLRRDALDVALVYDCFTIAMLVNLEDLGFAAKGQAGPEFSAGAFAAGSPLPVNTHGGLLSHGHPARAGGIGHLLEAVMQVRGEAGARQVAGADVAMAHGMGGVFATHGVVLLGAA
ncbi:MAG: thiolase family protein [Betaproteobacteria bacterium]|nr:thiolase family protein [Betaproteobacteria bacterium]